MLKYRFSFIDLCESRIFFSFLTRFGRATTNWATFARPHFFGIFHSAFANSNLADCSSTLWCLMLCRSEIRHVRYRHWKRVLNIWLGVSVRASSTGFWLGSGTRWFAQGWKLFAHLKVSIKPFSMVESFLQTLFSQATLRTIDWVTFYRFNGLFSQDERIVDLNLYWLALATIRNLVHSLTERARMSHP